MQTRTEKDDQMTTTKQRRSWGKIQRMRSGRFQAGYTGPDLARHHAPTCFTSKMDAEYWLASERRLIERGEWTAPELRNAANKQRGQLFSEYANNWLAQRSLKPRTRHLYEGLITGPLGKLSKTPLALISPETVRQWHVGLGTTTPTRNAHAYALLRTILGTAVTDGLVASNPCSIRGASTTHAKRQAEILTPDQIGKLALAVPRDLKALILIGGWCGLRFGELIGLRRCDISADASVITVALGVTHSRRQCFVSTPKTGKVRTVITPPHIRQDILDHLAHLVDIAPDSLLFRAPKTACRHVNEKTLRRRFEEALTSIGVDRHVVLHSLRHSAGTATAAAGATLRETMDRLGHNTIAASLRYQHSASGRDAEIADQLSRLAQTTG
jgi:integrase